MEIYNNEVSDFYYEVSIYCVVWFYGLNLSVVLFAHTYEDFCRLSFEIYIDLFWAIQTKVLRLLMLFYIRFKCRIG